MPHQIIKFMMRLIRLGAERLTVALLLRLLPKIAAYRPGAPSVGGWLRVSDEIGFAVKPDAATAYAARFNQPQEVEHQDQGKHPPESTALYRYRLAFDERVRHLNAVTRQAAKIAETPPRKRLDPGAFLKGLLRRK